MLASPTLTASRKRLVLWCAALTSSLIMLDTNIVAVSLPSIARDLHAGFAGVQWVITAYLVTFASLLLPAGSLADRYGRRRIVLAGIALFLASSAVCGLATSVVALEIARAVQGIGGSMLLTSALAIISSTFSGPERAHAYAFWGTAIGLAMASGPIAGGFITGSFGWRWAFLINVPLCLAFLAATRAFVPESRDPEASGFDGFGVATLIVGLFALTWALIDGNHAGWVSPAILSRMITAIVALTAFGFIETTVRRPMLDLRLFRARAVMGAACAMAGYGATAQVMIFFLPAYLQGALGFAPETAGFAMIPFAVPLFIAPRAAASMLRGWSHRNALTLSLGIVAAGNALLGAVATAGNYPLIALAMFLAGIGTGMLNPETVKAFQSQLPVARAGMASGIGATTRFISLLFGVAGLGAVFARFHPVVSAVRDPNVSLGFAAVAFVAAGAALVTLIVTAMLLSASPTAAAVPEIELALE